MIKFFRKIRQQLLSEGKIRNYIFYALGEITLVVIGILIALQIGTWSDERRNRKLEQVYYCKLLEDVTQDQVLVSKLMEENQERIAWVNQSIHLLQQKEVNREELAKAMRGSINLIRFNFKPSLSAFEDLKSSGKLEIIRDLELKKKLLNYYAVIAGYGDIQDIVADASLESYLLPSKNFLQSGFPQIDFVRAELDASLVDLQELSMRDAMPNDVREKLTNEAILHMNSNARKKAVFKAMESEIQEMKSVLEEKCKLPNSSAHD
jgi:hypothetical protein